MKRFGNGRASSSVEQVSDDAAAHEQVSLPSDDSLWAVGADHASQRVARSTDPVVDPPMYVEWILRKGRVLADQRGAFWSAGHRDGLATLASSAARAAAATADQTEATSAARVHQREIEALHDAAQPAGRGLPLLPRLPFAAYVVFLVGVALGETVFNVTAFRITGEKEWFVGVMATLVGISSAMSAHLIGGALEELTSTETTRRGRVFVRLGVGAGLALMMIGGLVAVASLRSQYLGVAQAGASAAADSSDTIQTSTGAAGMPEIGLWAPLALNLMVWVVAIGAAFNHACVHHSVDRKLHRHYRRAATRNRRARRGRARKVAGHVSGYEEAAHETRAALADVHALIDLVNAKALLYAAAYCSVLDAHGVEHFGIQAIPTLDEPAWASEAQRLLDGYQAARTQTLQVLTEDFVAATTAPLGSARVEAVRPTPLEAVAGARRSDDPAA